jgi:hypothetical protein
MFRYGSHEGLHLLSYLGNLHEAIHNAVDQTAMPSSIPKASSARVVRLLHAVWFGGSETTAHAWTVHFSTVCHPR